jgi:hypothetical protein
MLRNNTSAIANSRQHLERINGVIGTISIVQFSNRTRAHTVAAYLDLRQGDDAAEAPRLDNWLFQWRLR